MGTILQGLHSGEGMDNRRVLSYGRNLASPRRYIGFCFYDPQRFDPVPQKQMYKLAAGPINWEYIDLNTHWH